MPAGTPTASTTPCSPTPTPTTRSRTRTRTPRTPTGTSRSPTGPLAGRDRSGDHAGAEGGRHGVRAVAGGQLAEQPPGVRLHGVLGDVELPTHLRVALAVRHPPQHLH